MTSEPITDDDIKRLDAFLLSDDSGEDAMMIDEVHGFLTAVVSGPEMIMPSEWMPQLWGDAQFATMEQAQNISELVMRLYNDVLHSLRDGDFEPLFLERPQEDGDAIPIPEGWCVGYMRGIRLRAESWLPHLEKLSDWTYPISTFGIISEDGEEQILLPKTREEHVELTGKLSESAVEIYRYFLKHRSSPVRSVTRTTPKIGRNDPCHCGSGKKYKKCHGAPDESLH